VARVFLPLIVCTAFERNWGGVFTNAMVFISGTLSQNLDSEFFFKNSPQHVDRRKSCQLSSTEHGHRRQFITLSLHLCVQHDVRCAARRAGPSATVETCRVHYSIGADL